MKTVAIPAEFKCQTNMAVWKPFHCSLCFCPFSLPSLISQLHSLNLTLLVDSIATKLTRPTTRLKKTPGNAENDRTLTVMGPLGAVPHQIIHTRVSWLIRSERKGLLTQPAFANKSQDKFSIVWQGWIEDQRSLVLNLESHPAALGDFDRLAATTDRYLVSSRCCCIIIEDRVWELGVAFKEKRPCPSERWLILQHLKAAELKGLPGLLGGKSDSSISFLLGTALPRSVIHKAILLTGTRKTAQECSAILWYSHWWFLVARKRSFWRSVSSTMLTECKSFSVLTISSILLPLNCYSRAV